MLYLCKLITDRSGMEGIRIFECRGLDSLVVIPEEIKGQPVIELAPYIFSAQEDYDRRTEVMPSGGERGSRRSFLLSTEMP